MEGEWLPALGKPFPCVLNSLYRLKLWAPRFVLSLYIIRPLNASSMIHVDGQDSAMAISESTASLMRRRCGRVETGWP